MSTILELREKRAKAWDAAKAFLDGKRGESGLLSAEDTAVYEKMETDVAAYGKEIERLERQAAVDAELAKPTSAAITNRPNGVLGGDGKAGRASGEYKNAFWKAIRGKSTAEVMNSLNIGTDSEGGYLVPDEFERTLIEALNDANILRGMATVINTSSGERKIPVVASQGTAEWVEEEGVIPESDNTFAAVNLGAHKVATTLKVSDELLNDSAFNLETYIAR